MNDEDLLLVTECENVAKGATDGPWILDRSGSFTAIFADVSVTNRGETQTVRRQVSSWGGIKNEADARFAIRARTAMTTLCTMVREQDTRARHAEMERDAFSVRIDELEKQVQELTKAASSWDPVAVAKLETKNIELENECKSLRSRAGTCGGVRRDAKHIAKWLRLVADHLEKGGQPYVLSSDVPDRAPDAPCKDEMIEAFSVTLSLPWGG